MTDTQAFRFHRGEAKKLHAEVEKHRYAKLAASKSLRKLPADHPDRPDLEKAKAYHADQQAEYKKAWAVHADKQSFHAQKVAEKYGSGATFGKDAAAYKKYWNEMEND